jgi:membrane associated rhomboid family serine protease
MKEEPRSGRRKQQIQIPSVYRYMALGLLLPILVLAGMIIGYNYGMPSGDFSAAIFAALGSTVGLVIASMIIVKVALHWDKNISQYTRGSKTKRQRKAANRSGPD